MDNPLVTVVVPNWNGERWLPALLAALAAQSFRDFETVVIDNASTDRSRELLVQRAEVRLIPLTRNTGFTGAINAGLGEARGRFIVLLNNDMEPTPGFLGALVAAAEAHPEAGSFACRVRFKDDPGRIDSAGDRLGRSGRARGIGRGERDGPAFAKPRWVFGGTGGAVLFRREVLEETGGFDDDFFLYVEDTDVSFRAQLLGWKCLYVPWAITLHVGSGSMRGREDARARYCLRNHLFLLLKDYPFVLMPGHFLAIVGGIVTEIRFAFGATRVRHGGLRALLAVAGTLAVVALKAPKMLVKRLRLRRRVTLTEIDALFE